MKYRKFSFHLVLFPCNLLPEGAYVNVTICVRVQPVDNAVCSIDFILCMELCCEPLDFG
jgi:hypothetical protein